MTDVFLKRLDDVVRLRAVSRVVQLVVDDPPGQ